jgi:hypothetical protein
MGPEWRETGEIRIRGGGVISIFFPLNTHQINDLKVTNFGRPSE